MDIKKKFNEMSVLSPLLILYTIVYLGLMVYDFAARGAFEMPAGMMVVYIALLGAYAADKEIRRWMGQEEPPRAGSHSWGYVEPTEAAYDLIQREIDPYLDDMQRHIDLGLEADALEICKGV